MRRVSLWALSTLSALVLLFGYHTSTSGASGATAALAQPAATSSSRASSSSGAQTSRTVAGSVVQTRWGPVQVQVTLSGSRITNAKVLQYPQGNGRDIEINDQALPTLVQETVDAQSAHIDMVSGATYTSAGYIQSLQSALDKAGL